jgi:hypothetical protein
VLVEGSGKELNGAEVGRVLTEFAGKVKADLEPVGASAPMKAMQPTDNTVQPFQITVEFGEGK